jgi:hypothetical protein
VDFDVESIPESAAKKKTGESESTERVFHVYD